MIKQAPNQPRSHSFNNQGFLSNGPSGSQAGGPAAGVASTLLPNNGRIVQAGGVRVLCIADVRGNLRSLNELAKQARADHIIHTGDFGFYDESSLERIADKTLKHVAQYSPLLSEQTKRQIAQAPPQGPPVKQRFSPDQLPLSELSLFLNKTYTLDVPVYTVWGACEDVRVLEKFRSGEYKVDKLHIIDEANSRLLDVGGVKLRLLGLGGAVVMHKLFDNGEGKTTIAGGQGTMWTTLLQMGELVDTANRVYDPTETRIFVTHASPAREGLLNQLSVILKADFSISAGLHFRYGSSYNEFSVNPTLDHYRGKLAASKASFNDVWETVKSEVEPAVQQNDAQQTLLNNALDIVQKMPSGANGGNPFGGPVSGPNAGGQVDESAFKNMWNFNLADAAFGWLVLEVDGGRIGTEMRAQGFNFAHRGGKHAASQAAQAPVGSATQPGANIPPAASPVTSTQARSPAVPSAPPSQPFNQQQRGQGPPGQAANQQTQQTSKAPAGAQRAAASPAPAVPSQTVKPVTPQPSATNVALPPTGGHAPAPLPSGDVRNGTSASEKPTQSPVQKPISPVEKKPSTGIYIMNVATEEAVRDLFPEEDKAKIQRIDKMGKNFAVHFAGHEEMLAALDRQPAEHKKRTPMGQPMDKPHMKPYEERQPRDGAGRWQASNRGGAGGQQTGYRSGGASDSEGGRGGRGGFGRGRGRGSDRGRGRGGRGSFNKGPQGDGASPAPAPAAPSGGDS
ncbi:MAG: hypothetical protein M1819_003354 [Sarea resinae]|nr:MAG: hypothetical protein M1819_003354 [Sarea resinae]